MEPHRPKGQASLYDLGCTKRKRTEDDGPARELIIRLRPDVQQAVAARDAAIAASIASRPAPVKRPVGRPKVLAPLGVQAPPGERHVWAQLQLRWSGGEHQVRLHLHFTAKAAAAAAAAAEAQKLKKQAVWVPKFAKFANFLNFSGASQKLNARKLFWHLAKSRPRNTKSAVRYMICR